MAPGAEQTPGQSDRDQPIESAPVKGAQLGLKAKGAAKIARKHRHCACGIGHHGRQTSEHQRRKGQKSAATRHGVQHTCAKSRSNQQQHFHDAYPICPAQIATPAKRRSQSRSHLGLQQLRRHSPARVLSSLTSARWMLILKTWKRCPSCFGFFSRTAPFPGRSERAQAAPLLRVRPLHR